MQEFDDNWFKDLEFMISYGLGSNGKIPIGDLVSFKEMQRNYDPNNEEEAILFKDLTEEYKLKTIEAVFTSEKGDLRLRIPLFNLNKLRPVLEEFRGYASSEDQPFKGISIEDLGATIESIDLKTGEKTILGTNYHIYSINRDRGEKVKERDYDELNLTPSELLRKQIKNLRKIEIEKPIISRPDVIFPEPDIPGPDVISPEPEIPGPDVIIPESDEDYGER